MSKLDPITAAVIQNNLRSAAREMQNVLIRTGPAPIIYEQLDFGIELLDANFGTMAQSVGVTVFMGTASLSTKTSVELMGKENLKPGDVVITASHVTSGGHTPDAILFIPIFYEKKLFGYAFSKTHWVDIGAKIPGGHPTDSTETFGEGIRIPPVRLYKEGVLDSEIKEFIQWNSRLPDTVWGECQAQLASARKGEERVIALLDKYGVELVSAAVQEMYDHDEKLARDAIREMPDGTWTIEDYLDSNGVELDKPVKVKITVTIHGSDMTIDYSGSAEEQKGPVNGPFITMVGLGRLVVKALTSPSLPASEGSFRPVEVIAPEGCLFHPGPLAPTIWLMQAVCQPVDLINKALHSAMPERVPACSGMDPCSGGVHGWHPQTGKRCRGGNMYPVGQGASFSSDGESAVYVPSGSAARITPNEVQESLCSCFLIERLELAQDTGGPGKYRGGLGLKHDFKLLQPMVLGTLTGRGKFPHWGLEGGAPGGRNYSIVQSKAKGEYEILAVSNVKLDEGDRWLHRPGGGGGYGNPLERDIEAVRQDVINEYVSVESAKRDYGVVINPHTFDIDIEATKKLRRCAY